AEFKKQLAGGDSPKVAGLGTPEGMTAGPDAPETKFAACMRVLKKRHKLEANCLELLSMREELSDEEAERQLGIRPGALPGLRNSALQRWSMLHSAEQPPTEKELDFLEWLDRRVGSEKFEEYQSAVGENLEYAAVLRLCYEDGLSFREAA